MNGESDEDRILLEAMRGEKEEFWYGYIVLYRPIFGQNYFAESEAIAGMLLLKVKRTLQCVHMLFSI